MILYTRQFSVFCHQCCKLSLQKTLLLTASGRNSSVPRLQQPRGNCRTYVRRVASLQAEPIKENKEDVVSGHQQSNENTLHINLTNSDKQVEDLLQDAASFEENQPESHEDVWSTSPYPHGSPSQRDQSKHAVRPKVDPRETSIILFPGQGSQFVGMGKDLLKFPIVQDMFEAANDILEYNLLELCLKGPQKDLDKTIFCQPAILVSSLAAVEKLKEERPQAIEDCVATAGFSIGEITALVFAGSLTFEDALRLVKVRAEAMQIASEITPSGMMTVMYGPDSQLNHACKRAKDWCRDRGIEDPECCVANYLYPHCKVIAGHSEALRFIEENVEQFKLRRLRRLPVSGAFHTSLMKPASEPFREALRNVRVSNPLISVHSNVDGKMYRNTAHIVKQLPKQIYRPVRWEQTLHVLYERAVGTYFPNTFECGPKNSLKTILKMVNGKAWDHCFSIEA